jgi:menaquinone-dependent protoporphyrinogen oxidase
MPNILVVYASKHGHTAKIAARLAETLRADGATAALEPAASDPSPHAFDAVVVGASIHAGHHQREVIDWIERHRDALAHTPAAFFSVCLAAADETDESLEETQRYIDEFIAASGWTPQRSITFAGALQYREYDFMTRLLMRLLMWKGHHPTDTSRDYDYTDWAQVEQFAHDCGALAGSATAQRAGG